MSRASPTTTIEDVARRARVSTATVSRVVNGLEVVREATAARVRQAIRELDYLPSQAARVLASNRTDTLGILLPEISGAFFQPMLRGVETAASEAGYDLMVHTTQNPHLAGTPRRPLAEHNTDGLLVFTDSLDRRELTRLYRNRFPTVLMHQTPPRGVQLPYITIENQSGARRIVDHLITAHHRRRIVFLRGPKGHEDSDWRERGYREALGEHDLPFDPALVMRGGFNRDEARQALEKHLGAGLDFDAVFAGDDDASVGVLLALRQAGVSVPQEVSVAGFDDQVFSSTLVPPLTTVHAPTEQVGMEAVRLLVRMIRGEKVEPRLILQTKIVIRESCGCKAP